MKIDNLKRELINPLIDSENPKFDSKYDFDFNFVKLRINDDIIFLVKFFLLCIKELRRKEKKESRLLVSLLIGQQEYKEDNILRELTDSVDYGHLRKLEEIYLEYKNTEDMYYLKMIKTLCSPYIDVMRNVIYMCGDLFKSESILEFKSKKEIIYPKEE